MFQDILSLILKYKGGFIGGITVTFQISILVWLFGIFLGIPLGIFAGRKKYINILLGGVSFFLSGVPVLVFLYWLHYPAQAFLEISIDPFFTVVFMISILNIIAVGEMVKNGVINFPKQYTEVAKVCGVSNRNIFFKIQFPLIFRHILPSLLMTQVNMLHMTLFGSLISVDEIFRISQRVISLEYKAVEVYTALGIFFLLISLPINGLAIILKRKFRNLDER